MEALKIEDLEQGQCYTIDDIYALPDGQRAELIDGRKFDIAMPDLTHQKTLGFLCNEIYGYIRSNDGKCQVLPAPFAVFLNKDKTNYVEPDISVICDEEKLDEKGCHGAPDWVIEIVSPSSRRMDYYIKLFKYRSAGVREYWIVDPIKQRVTVHHFEKEDGEEYAYGEEVPAGIFEGFSVKVQ